MVEFTYQQKIATMRVLLDIIHADGKVDARETFLFDKMKEEFGLSDEDHVVVNGKNSLLALTQIRLFDDEQKAHLANLMSQMIIVDEDINVNEVAVFDVVCDACGINVNFNDSISEEDIQHCTKS